MRIARALHILQPALKVKDRPLRRTHRGRLVHSRKASAEKQRRRLRHEHHALAELTPEQIASRRLTTTGPAREHDATASILRGIHAENVACSAHARRENSR